MICKWCGARIGAGEVRCRTCGRENPPMSDCGGFAAFPGAPQQGAQAELSELRNALQRVSAQQKKSRAQLLTTILAAFLILSCLFAVSLLITGVQRSTVSHLVGRVDQLEEQIDRLEQMIEELPDATDAGQEEGIGSVQLPEMPVIPSESETPGEPVDGTEEG